MTRQTFSDHVLRDWHRSHLEQTAEEIAEALQIPLHKLLERARRAGIVLSHDPTPLQEAAKANAQWAFDIATRPQQNVYTKVAQYVPKVLSRCDVEDRGFRNPFER